MIPAAFPSHVAAFEALARELARRGHHVYLVQRAGVADWLPQDSPLVPAIAGEGGAPVAAILARAARPGFPFGILRVVRDMAAATERLCRDGAAALRACGAEAVIADPGEPAGAILAARLGLNWITLSPALPLDRDPALPPPMLGWRYDPSERGLGRNRGGRQVADLLMRPVNEAVARLSEGRWTRIEDCTSPRAALWQLVPSLDFPRSALPSGVSYAGALRREAGAERPLPVTPLGGRPLAYASLGTMQGHRLGLFRRIARACRRAGIELVVSHCGRLAPQEAALIGADHVVADLPQRAMIARADLVITHGGVNTVLDAAEAGRPMLVLPIAFDQPGLAARVERAGAGLALDHRFAGSGRMASAMARLLGEPGFAAAARRIGDDLRAAPGAAGAAAIAELALADGRPMDREAA